MKSFFGLFLPPTLENATIFLALSVLFLFSFLFNDKYQKEIRNIPYTYNQPTGEHQLLRPTIDGGVLTTPLINGNWPERIRFHLSEGWAYRDFSFPLYDFQKTVSDYYVLIENATDPRYRLTFFHKDIEYVACDFNDSYGDSFLFQIDIPNLRYKEIDTDFGKLRIGESKDNNFVVCQYTEPGNNYPGGWASVTDIGYIRLELPKPHSEEKLNEMISIIKNTEQIGGSNTGQYINYKHGFRFEFPKTIFNRTESGAILAENKYVAGENQDRLTLEVGVVDYSIEEIATFSKSFYIQPKNLLVGYYNNVGNLWVKGRPAYIRYWHSDYANPVSPAKISYTLYIKKDNSIIRIQLAGGTIERKQEMLDILKGIADSIEFGDVNVSAFENPEQYNIRFED